ncbi:WG repeat-containing protein [Psychrobacter sp. I-STPA6b]|uniref:WG repeat-containing protein n=1 Tax=Psychrobacter sp. I-STPA6b TaxID=2585718 RepID=UPI001D0C27F5|nr:WG repeat-containing protein [Psychrobacter sp. I-STPA6b]
MQKLLLNSAILGLSLLITNMSLASADMAVSKVSLQQHISSQQNINDKYDWVIPLSEEVSLVFVRSELGVKQGIINNTTGKEIIPIIYDRIHDYYNGVAIVEIDKKYGLVDNNANQIIPLIYDYMKFQKDGTIKVGLDNKYGLFNQQGEQIISIKYDHIGMFSEGLLAVTLNGHAKYIDNHENIILDTDYDYAHNFQDGLAWVIKDLATNQKFALINKKGNLVVPFIYDSARDFSEGLAEVCAEKKCGYINRQGKVIIALQYDSVSTFENGIAKVYINEPNTNYGHHFCIDTTGKRTDCPIEEIAEAVAN